MQRTIPDISEVDSLEAADAFAEALVGEDANTPQGAVEVLLARAVAAYVADDAFFLPEERKTRSLLQMFSMVEIVAGMPDLEHDLDILFEEVETGRYYFDETDYQEIGPARPDHPALQRYREFKQAAKTPLAEYVAANRLYARVLDIVAEEESVEAAAEEA